MRHARRGTDPLREFRGRGSRVLASHVSPDWRQGNEEWPNTFDGADGYVIIRRQCRVSTTSVVFRE